MGHVLIVLQESILIKKVPVSAHLVRLVDMRQMLEQLSAQVRVCWALPRTVWRDNSPLNPVDLVKLANTPTVKDKVHVKTVKQVSMPIMPDYRRVQIALLVITKAKKVQKHVTLSVLQESRLKVPQHILLVWIASLVSTRAVKVALNVLRAQLVTTNQLKVNRLVSLALSANLPITQLVWRTVSPASRAR
jgi:hypothetical protein